MPNNVDRPGQRPQDAEKADQRDDIRQQADAQRQRVIDEVADVLGDPLVRVVGADGGAVGGQADPVIGTIGKPLIQEALPSASGASGSAATARDR